MVIFHHTISNNFVNYDFTKRRRTLEIYCADRILTNSQTKSCFEKVRQIQKQARKEGKVKKLFKAQIRKAHTEKNNTITDIQRKARLHYELEEIRV